MHLRVDVWLWFDEWVSLESANEREKCVKYGDNDTLSEIVYKRNSNK